MNDGIRKILGKRITGVIGREDFGSSGPEVQLALVFDDGTWYEIWCSNAPMGVASDLDRGGFEDARRYLEKAGAAVTAYRLEARGQA